ncbi:MAG: glycosyltransferase [Oligoflexia bacterium]|nr:glycosyltransferase [Oligoflexia bacterium]
MKDQKVHTFVILAYKQSPFLEECIQSVQRQAAFSNIIVVTSTPNQHIDSLAKKYSLPLILNANRGTIAEDWSFGFKQATTPYVTLAHQDDIYFEHYTEELLSYTGKHQDALIYFSNYLELSQGSYRKSNRTTLVKRCMLLPLYLKSSISVIFLKKMMVSFGCPIMSSSIMYNKRKLNDFNFDPNYTINLDWDAYWRLANKKGAFLFHTRPLMAHRIHPESETSCGIRDGRRQGEDATMFYRIWPNLISKILIKIYSLCYSTNRVEES